MAAVFWVNSFCSTTYTFPNLTLYFEGGTMELGPDSYLEQASDVSGFFFTFLSKSPFSSCLKLLLFVGFCIRK